MAALQVHKITAPETWDHSLLPAGKVRKVREPEIIHSPIKDILLENNAMRANSLLISLLASLSAKEAIIDPNWDCIK